MRQTFKKRTVRKPKSRFFLPYPLIIFLLLGTGVLLVNWSLKANADDILVTALVKGPTITGPAVITSPTNNTRFTAVPVTVSGSCPANAAYVEIFRNDFMSGSAMCTGSGTFELQIDLFPGRNDLTARSFNITDDEGPASAIVTVFYDQPAPAPGTPVSTGSGKPLTVKTAFVYKGYYVGQTVQWPLEINGGSAPYALNVNWGDGTDSIISRKADGQFNISHTYKTAGGERGNFIIKVQASDSAGGYTYLQFFVLVNAKSAAGAGGNIYTKPPPSLGGLAQWLWVAWPAYLSVFLMVVGYKLGEREEYLILRRRGQLRRS